MPIEIKQLEIRGRVSTTEGSVQSNSLARLETDKLKREILESCKDMIERFLETKANR